MFRSLFKSCHDRCWVALIALAIAIIGARPYAGGWNDGSRLAAVDSLSERGTFSIDDSVFVRVPADGSPYDPSDADLQRTGTLDKLRIGGKYYSDKSPVPSLILAGLAKALRLFGIGAPITPHLFCWFMNLAGGGLCFVAAVCALFRICRALNLSRMSNWALTLSFAIGTIALPYSRHVNNHIQLLAVVAWLLAYMLDNSGHRFLHCARLGFLAGLGYTIDLGMGPVLLLCVGAWILWQCRWRPSWRARAITVGIFTAASLPWLAVHHAVNFAIAGTVGPANAVPEYLQWPGSPFDSANMTGRLQHATLSHLVIYALDMLVGQKGFLGHNLPAYLAVAATPWLLTKKFKDKSLLVFAVLFSAGAFLAYAVSSNNYSGRCLSIRWFVPLLAPAYLMLGLALRARPSLIRYLIALSTSSAIWAALAWFIGPWQTPPLIWYWIIGTLGVVVAAALAIRQYQWTNVLSQLARRWRIRFGASILRASSE